MTPFENGSSEGAYRSGGVFLPRHFTEEEWIDWLGGEVTGPKRDHMRQHLDHCPACQELVRTWGPLLAAEAGPADTGSAAAHQTAIPMPSDSVRRSLRRRVQLRGLRRRLAGIRPLYKRSTAALAGFAAIAVLSIGLSGMRDGDAERKAYVSSYEPQALAVINRPETVSYALDPAGQDPFSGNIWYNEASGELFVLLDDLTLSDKLSLQAWAVSGERRDPLGLIRIEAAKGHLYIKNGQLGEADNIALTVEPYGGSQYPTSPDAVRVQLLRP